MFQASLKPSFEYYRGKTNHQIIAIYIIRLLKYENVCSGKTKIIYVIITG